MSDIHMSAELTPPTYNALARICVEKQWCAFRYWMPAEKIALLAVRLRYVDDTPENFPGGKWATIQHLEHLVDDYVQKEDGE